jgi:conjugal transfer pilus assembly protein TrbC
MKKEVTMKEVFVTLGLLGSLCCGTVQGKTLAGESSSTQATLQVFVSLSMFKGVLLQWHREAKRYAATVVLQGFLNDSLKDTLKALHVEDDPTAVLPMSINPTAFQRYGIKQVPAVVLAKGDRFDVVYGNAGIQAALVRMTQAGELAKEAQVFLDQVEKP